MREETLRWGLLMGVIAAILGALAFAVGALLAPLRLYTSAEAVATAYFARGMLGFIALGVALGLAYYAGLRSERDMRQALAAQAASDQAGVEAKQDRASMSWGQRWNAVNSGAIVMLCFWIASTICSYVFPLSQPGVPQPQNQALADAELHLILLVVYILFGAGVGGIGGRSYTSRVLLDRVIVMPPSLPSIKLIESVESAHSMDAAAATPADAEPAAPEIAEQERIAVTEAAQTSADA